MESKLRTMSASPEFIAYVKSLLLPLGNIEYGSFFGGFSFKQHGKQFAMIMGNTLYFCVNDDTRPKYKTLGLQPFSYTTKKGRVYVKKYFTVPEELFEDQAQLMGWANEAIQAAHAT